MGSATLLRARLEAALGDHIPGAFALKARQAPERFPTGFAELDRQLGGGVPRGGITEIAGAATTGRTSLALSLLAQITRRGAACAWVDAEDAFDPESAAAHDIHLERLLWLRAGGAAGRRLVGPQSTERRAAPQISSRVAQGASGQHSRNEARTMDSAVSRLFRGEDELLRDKKIGTPGAPNLVLEFMAPRCSEPQPHRRRIEQIASDRLPPRRGEVALERREHPCFDETAGQPERNPLTRTSSRTEKPWMRLDQALRATDLLLQAGGFGAIVLDMGDIRPAHLLRIPIASWHRFRLAAEQAQTALVLLTQSPCAKSCASLVLRCDRAATNEGWRDEGKTPLFTSLCYRAAVERKRGEDFDPAQKKAVTNATAAWRARATWAGR